MKKILVTGGTGYIGSHTIIDLIEHGYQPISVDNGSNSYMDTLDLIHQITSVRVPNYELDLCHKSTVDQIFSEHEFHGVIHFAAFKSVPESMQNPLAYFKNNLDSLLNILEAVVAYEVPSFIFSSSCTVYGDARSCPITEETPWLPAASPYGRTKQIGEQITEDSIRNTKSRYSILRYFNPAGAHPSGLIGERPKKEFQNLVPMITRVAKGELAQLKVFGTDYPTRDGSCIRDYIHVCDLAHAHTRSLSHLLSAGQDTEEHIFNVGLGEGVSVLEMVHAFEEATGIRIPTSLEGRRAGDAVAVYADPSLIKERLGWSPKYSIRDIMESAWKWDQNQAAE